jgi:hypothetical protein
MRHYFSVHVSPYHCFSLNCIISTIGRVLSSLKPSQDFSASRSRLPCTPKSKPPTNLIILAVLILLRPLIRSNVPIWIHQTLKGHLTDTFVLIIQRKHRFPELFVFPQIYDDGVYLS